MSVFDDFASLIGMSSNPPLDAAYHLVARALVGDGVDTMGLLDDLAAATNATDASGLMSDLFASGRIIGDGVTYDDPANSFIHSVLERGRGIPLTLSVIAIEVGRRRGIHLAPVGMHGHFLLRSATDSGAFFDPFHGGQRLDREACRELYGRVTGVANWDDAYLAVIDTRLVMLRQLNNLKSSYRRRDRLAELRCVMALRSRFPELAEREAAEFARLMRSLN